MSKCSFSFHFPIRAEELIRRIGAAIRDAGGELSGDSEQGFYSVPTPVGNVDGSYVISGQTIQIDVLEKPLVLTCGFIEKTLKALVRRAQG